MHYPIRRALICCLIGLCSGAIAIILWDIYQEWSAPSTVVRLSWRGFMVLAAFGGSIGAVSGFIAGIVARPTGGDKRFERVLYLAVILIGALAWTFSLPLLPPLPQEWRDFMSKP